MESLKTIERMNLEEFGEYLVAEGIHEEVVTTFSENRICGKTLGN